MLNFEYAVLDWIRDTLSGDFLDTVMPIITFFGDKGWFWIALGIVLTIIPKTRKVGVTVLVSLVFSVVICNILLKPMIARVRPYDLRDWIELIIAKPHDFSFPSGHSSASFAAATAVFCYNKKWGAASLILAALIAFSRLYLYVHFPSDVLAGAILGIIGGVVAFNVVKLIYAKIEEKRTT